MLLHLEGHELIDEDHQLAQSVAAKKDRSRMQLTEGSYARPRRTMIQARPLVATVATADSGLSHCSNPEYQAAHQTCTAKILGR